MTVYLIITGLIFLAVGVRALLKPIDAVADPFSLKAEGADAMNYLRSGTGGVTLACGAVLLAGGFVPALAFAAIVLAVTVLGGLTFGRIVSLAMDGSPGPLVWASAIFEIIGLVSGVFWLYAGSAQH